MARIYLATPPQFSNLPADKKKELALAQTTLAEAKRATDDLNEKLSRTNKDMAALEHLKADFDFEVKQRLFEVQAAELRVRKLQDAVEEDLKTLNTAKAEFDRMQKAFKRPARVGADDN